MLTNLRWMFLLTIVCEGMLFSLGVGSQSKLDAQDQIAIGSQPNANALQLYERARSYSAAGDARAEEAYRQAIAARRGKYPEAWKGLSFYLAHELRFDEAETALKKYLKQTHQKVPATEVERLNRLNRASLLKSQCDNGDVLSAEQMAELVSLIDGFGAKGDAIPYAEKAVKAHPESTKALVVMADLIKWEQKDRALELLNRAVAFDPNEPSVYVARGWCYFWAHGNPTEAASDFRRAIELSQGLNASAWAGLGDALARIGQRHEAIAAYRKYLSIRPKSLSHNDGAIRQSIEKLRSNNPQTVPL